MPPWIGFDFLSAIVAANDNAGVFDLDGFPAVLDFPVADRAFPGFHAWYLSLDVFSDAYTAS
jgi:hypothetical protein